MGNYAHCGYSHSATIDAGQLPPRKGTTSLMRFYRALLRLYPASFRAEYGTQHLAVTLLVVNYEEIRH